jgi:hypothetical protein
MVMEYLKFVLAMAAMGILFNLVWRAFSRDKRTIASRKSTFNPKREPIPPVKRVTDGPSSMETGHVAFEDRIDTWQKNFEVHREQAATTPAIPVNGQKYEFVPPKTSRAGLRTRNAPEPPFRQRFELIG